jgi:hypothetical protein
MQLHCPDKGIITVCGDESHSAVVAVARKNQFLIDLEAYAVQ